MNLHKIYSIFFLPFIVGLLTMLVVTGCSDDDEELQSQYGYVQFKLYKSTSLRKEQPLVLWANLNQCLVHRR